MSSLNLQLIYMETIKIGIIEDNQLLALSYKMYFSEFATLEVIFNHNSFEELEYYIKNAKSKKPNIVFLDLLLPGKHGLHAIPLLLRECPEVKILVLSAHTEIEKIMQVLKMGAHGYISKAMPITDLERAIHDVQRYGTYISPDIVALLLQHTQKKMNINIYSILSKRELDIALAIVDGKSYKELALELYVSVFTINHHLKNIYRKLNVKSKSELIALLLSGKKAQYKSNK